jgi:hypothetical protein
MRAPTIFASFCTAPGGSYKAPFSCDIISGYLWELLVLSGHKIFIALVQDIKY